MSRKDGNCCKCPAKASPGDSYCKDCRNARLALARAKKKCAECKVAERAQCSPYCSECRSRRQKQRKPRKKVTLQVKRESQLCNCRDPKCSGLTCQFVRASA